MSSITQQFTGITVRGIENNSYNLSTDNGEIHVFQNLVTSNEHCKTVEFTFEISKPTRFRIDFLLPDDVSNACVTLNNKILLGLFSPKLPKGCNIPYEEECKNSDLSEDPHERLTTLKPGHFQSINFKWYGSDVLKFHLYY